MRRRLSAWMRREVVDAIEPQIASTSEELQRALDDATTAIRQAVHQESIGTNAAIGELTRKAWEEHGRAFSESRLSPKMLADVDKGATGGIAAAPVHVVVCADIERGLEVTIGSSIFPAVQNLLLAATAVGLGSALTTITTTYRAELRELLALPAPVVPVAVVPIGHPARELGRPRREPFAAHTHREQYGKAW